MMKKEYQELQIDLLLLLRNDILTFSFEEDVDDDIFNDKPEGGDNW